MIGETLSHFRITAKLGEGGMGEVYRAEDTKLGREVAIKVLPEAVANDPERLARFEREAKVLASLNHPHIAAIYSIESAIPPGRPRARLAPQDEVDAALDKPTDDQEAQVEADDLRAKPHPIPAKRDDHPSRPMHFLVMELAEGEDLSKRLGRGPIPVAEVLPLALQIAGALEAAHGRGIIHRDLKPANIKVDAEGNVKLLDFGLAKILGAETAVETDLSLSPTLTAEMTQAGTILGTASYMSPEQARGQEVDSQTDIWAFGVVLFEMLTGEQVFAGDTVTDTIAAIIEREPSWEALPTSTAPLLRSVLRRCMQKDRRHRLHDMADARLELEEAIELAADTPEGTDSAWQPRRILAASLSWLIAGVLLGSLASWWLLPQEKGIATPSASSARLTVTLTEGTDLYLIDNPGLAISPDGRRLAWVASTSEGGQQIFVREIDQFEARVLPGTEDARGPFFSPEGEWIGFFRDRGGLEKVGVSGGAPMHVVDTPSASKGGTWGSNGEIVYSYGFNGGLHRVSEDGGESRILTTVDRESGEKSHRFPHFLPDGRAVVFMVSDTETDIFSESRIEVVELESGERRRLIDGGMSPRYASSGRLLWAREGELMAASFDLDHRELTGAPQRVLDGVITNEGWGFGQYDLAKNGTLLYAAGGPETYAKRLVQRDRQGRVEPLPIPERFWSAELVFSPDGRTLALVDTQASFDIWLWDLKRQILSRLTRGGNNHSPTWSPDGRGLIFQSDRRGGTAADLYWSPIDGSGPERLLLQFDETVWPTSWSPDGRHLVFSRAHPERSYDLWVLPIGDDMSAGTPELLVGTPALEHDAKFSPDGKWLVYRSDAAGRPEIMLRAFPGPGPVQQISAAGGVRPAWGREGDEIFYVDPVSRELMRVALRISPNRELGVPEPLFVTDSTDFRFAVSPDGDHFVLLQPGSKAGPVRELRIALDWLQRLPK